MAAGDILLLAPVPTSADDAQLLGRLSKLRVALRKADQAILAKVLTSRTCTGERKTMVA